MKKNSLVFFLESMNKDVTEKDELIHAIYESRPDLMQLDSETPKNGMYDITDKESPNRAIDDFEADEEDEEVDPEYEAWIDQDIREYDDEEIEEDEINEKSKDYEEVEEDIEITEGGDEQTEKTEVSKPLTIKSDIGSKRIAFDDSFRNMTDDKLQSISDVFSADEVNMINESEESNWKEIDRRMIMCKEKDYKNPASKKFNCFNSSNPTGQGRPNKFPRAYVEAFYKPTKVGDLKDANGRYVIFESKSKSEPIYSLLLREKKGRNRYAIKFQISGEENEYLMVASDLHRNFIYKDVQDD